MYIRSVKQYPTVGFSKNTNWIPKRKNRKTLKWACLALCSYLTPTRVSQDVLSRLLLHVSQVARSYQLLGQHFLLGQAEPSGVVEVEVVAVPSLPPTNAACRQADVILPRRQRCWLRRPLDEDCRRCHGRQYGASILSKAETHTLKLEAP